MATLYSSRSGTDNERWPHGESARREAMSPVPGTNPSSNSRLPINSRTPHIRDGQGSDRADRDRDDQGRHDRDQDSDNDNSHSPRRGGVPVPKSQQQHSYGDPRLPRPGPYPQVPMSYSDSPTEPQVPRSYPYPTIADKGSEGFNKTTRKKTISSRSGTPLRRKEEEDVDSGDSYDDLQPLHFFVPGENINAAVLVEYINRYVDRTAKITSAQHPTDRSRTGFNVLAKRALNASSIRDLINDSKDWDVETQGREYRRDPYDYRESDTARRRARKGPSEGGTNLPQQPRRKTESTPTGRRDDGSAPQPNYNTAPYSSSYQAQAPSYPSNTAQVSYSNQHGSRNPQYQLSTATTRLESYQPQQPRYTSYD